MGCFKKSKTARFKTLISLTVSITAFVIFMLTGCEKVEKPVYDNPIDPLNENFLLPEAYITNSLSQDTTLRVTDIFFYWNGVSTKSRYSHMLMGYDTGFSEWVENSKSVFYSHLDEGSYTFLVKESYNDIIVQAIPDSWAFNIDAVTNCALLLRKWKVNAINTTPFSIYLDLENVNDLKGMTTIIEFPPGRCELLSVEQMDNSIEGEDGLLFLTTSVAESNVTGELVINAIGLGSGIGFTGNTTICKLNFSSKSNISYSIDISIPDSELRDINNNPISVGTIRGTVVNLSSI